MERKSALKLTSKMHTGFGIVSFVMGLLTVVFFLIAVYISAFGNRSVLAVQYQIGVIEILAMLFNLVGIVFGVTGEMTKETFKLYAHLGLGINGIAFVFHLLVIVFS